MLWQHILSSWSIRKKLLLLILMVFLPAAGILVVSGIEERGREISIAENNILLLVQSLAAQQEQIAMGTMQMLSTLAQLPALQRLDAQSCDELFHQLTNKHPFYSFIGAVKPDGTLLASSVPFDPTGVNLSDRKHIRDAKNSLDFSVGEYQVGRISKDQFINYSYPVLDAANHLIAIVVARFKLDEYARFIAKANLPQDSAVIIADYKGIRLYRVPEDDAAAVGKPISSYSFERMSGDLDQGLFEMRGDDGIFRIYAFKRLRLREDSPPYLFMTVGVAKDKVVHTPNIKLLNNLLALGLATLIALSFAWFFSDATLIGPINRLVMATRRLGSGETGVRTGLFHSGDELGGLAKSIDDMAALLETKDLEQKKTEGSLRNSEEKARWRAEELQKLMDLVPIPIWVAHDAQCRHITGNRSAIQIFNAEEGENLSPNPTNGPPVQHRQFFRGGRELAVEELPMQYAASQGVEVQDEEVEVLLPGGRRITLLGSAVPLRDTHGGVRGCISAFMDITQRKRAEMGIQQNQAKLQAALASMTDAVFISDVEGRFIDFNDAFATFHKFKDKDECLKTLAEYLEILDVFMANGELAPLDMWAVPRALRGETATNEEVSLRRKDTGETWAGSYSFAPIRDKDGVIVGSVVVGRDITEHKRAEEALRNSEKELRFLSSRLLRVQEEERRMVAREIHDSFGSTLAAIKMSLQNVRCQINESETLGDLLDAPIAWTQHAINEVRRLVTELRPQVLDDMGAIAAINWFLEHYRTTYPGIRVEADVRIHEGDIPESLRIVIFRITQEAFHNIAKYGQAEYATLSLVKQAGALNLIIEDNGRGFDLEATLSKLHENRGLGLAYMRERTELFGGSFSIRSRLGRGTILKAVWPLSPL